MWSLLACALAPPGVQAAMARCDEDRVWEPSKVWDHLLQEIPWVLRHRRWWGALCLHLALLCVCMHVDGCVHWRRLLLTTHHYTSSPIFSVVYTQYVHNLEGRQKLRVIFPLAVHRQPLSWSVESSEWHVAFSIKPLHHRPGLEASSEKLLVFPQALLCCFVDPVRAVAKWN